MTSEEPTLKIGDVVVLKSGGPAMTIVRQDAAWPEPYWICHWFTEDE